MKSSAADAAALLIDMTADQILLFSPFTTYPEQGLGFMIGLKNRRIGRFSCVFVKTDEDMRMDVVRAIAGNPLAGTWSFVTHLFEDDLSMAEMAATIWPEPRTRAILAAVEDECKQRKAPH